MSQSMNRHPVCAVVGVGPGNGAAFARRFARAGYRVALLARAPGYLEVLAQEIPESRVYTCDVTDPASVQVNFTAIRGDLGQVDALIYNAGSGQFGTIDDITPEAFEASWRVNALGSLLVSQQVIPAMKQAGHGLIVFIGATASLRGGAQSAAFAPAKAAQRALAQSMARHLWPSGVHVALVVIDGVVDLAATRAKMPGKPDSFFVQPDDVAEIVYRLAEQKPSAWSFEVEARPFGERW